LSRCVSSLFRGRSLQRVDARSEVLFTSSWTGDYDKIGRPLQDGVGRLIRFSPRDDTVQLSSSTSVAIQLPRPDRQAPGVTRLGPDGCFLYFDVALSSNCGFFRDTVRFGRTAMEQSGLTRWSVDELTVLYTLHAGVPGHYGLPCIASWCDLIVCLFSSPVAYKLSSMTDFVYWKCGEHVCVLFACVSVRLYVYVYVLVLVWVCACVCACYSVRVCVCVTVCGVCVRVCVVKSWRPGLRSMCVCVWGNVKPWRLESTSGRQKERTPTRGHTRLNPPPPRATRG